MANAKIQTKSTTKKQKTIAFLITGSELINGEILDTNSHQSSALIHQKGGSVKTKIIVGDVEQEISNQLLHLLDTHDAVITIGGLGPTSDDRTRFAISKALNLSLELHEDSWQYVQERLSRFGIKVNEANKQQAMFPQTAQILKNEFGTANACYLRWNNKDIFMLPGPPREYWPLFENKVLPFLTQAQYFSKKKTYRFLTLGLIEGEISYEIDEIAEKYQILTGYRWCYPYLEIKLDIDEETIIPTDIIKEVEGSLENFIVSTDGKDAKELLINNIKSFTKQITVNTTADTCILLKEFEFSNISFEVSDSRNDEVTVIFNLTWPDPNDPNQVLKLGFIGKEQDQIIYQHQLQTPKRENDIELYIQSYFAWQLNKFIEKLHNY